MVIMVHLKLMGDDDDTQNDTRDIVGGDRLDMVSYSSLITQPFKAVDFADVLFISFATSLSKLTCQSRGNLIQRVLLFLLNMNHVLFILCVSFCRILTTCHTLWCFISQFIKPLFQYIYGEVSKGKAQILPGVILTLPFEM